jgi:hypothetical protein
MSAQIDVGYRTFLVSTGYTGGLAGATTGGITAYLAVDIQSDGTITPANAAKSVGVGILQEDVQAGQYGRVKLWSGQGTFMAQVSGSAVTPGTLYSIVTGGYVSTATAGGVYAGTLTALQSGVASAGIVLEFAIF